MKILIVGAGIAGLTMAKALELKGYSPELIERRANPPTSGQGIFLLGNAARALRDLGLQDQVLADAHAIKAQRIFSSRGALLNDVDTSVVWGECGPCVALPRQSLIRILLSSLRRTKITFSATAQLTMDRGDAREVCFANGRIDGFDLVIGADGVNSALRSCVFPTSQPQSVGLACWRMILPNDGSIDAWTAMLGRKRTLLAIPINATQLYVYADCSSSEFGDGSIENFKKLFRGFNEPLRRYVERVDKTTIVHTSFIEEVPYDTFIADRFVLIGDAAHASSPSMAQGAAMAMEDALVLAAAIKREPSIQHALASYSRQRQQRVNWVQKQAKARDKLRGSSDLVRGAILRSLGTPLYKRTYDPLAKPLPYPGA